MDVKVRPARTEDQAAGLLYESAAPYYDAFAGDAGRARRILQAVWPRRAHTASYEVCHVAEVEGKVVGVIAAFPTGAADRLARRFLRLTAVRVPSWRWPALARHLSAAAHVTPHPPAGSFYVDALAVAPDARRRGVASALLDEAVREAGDRGATGVALDTGLRNQPAQSLYEHYGFERRETREAPDDRTAKAIGGPGFVAYFKRLG